MRRRSSDRARPAGSTRRFAGLLAIAATMVAALFIVTPALAVFTVPISPSTVAVQQWQSPTISVPSGLGCTWSALTTDPTTVTLDWTNAQSWSTTQIEKNTNGGAYSNSGSAVGAGISTVTATSLSVPATNNYGFKAKAVRGTNWISASTSAVNTTTCRGAINEAADGSVNAKLSSPNDTAVDSAGNVFIADSSNHRIRKIDATTDIITTVAGTGSSGLTGDGGVATNAKVATPKGVWVDANDNLLIADSSNSAVRLLYRTSSTFSYGIVSPVVGNLYTIAGLIGSSGSAGDGQTAIGGTVRMNAPQDIATDSANNLFITDGPANKIRCVAGTTSGASYCNGGGATTAGFIYTFAGNGTAGYLADNVAANATRVSAPTGITVTSTGDVIFGDKANGRIREVYSGSGQQYGGASGPAGVAMTQHFIYSLTSGLNAPWGITRDSSNTLIFGESGAGYVKAIFNNGTTKFGITNPTAYNVVYTIAGNGGASYNGTGMPLLGASAATIAAPNGVSMLPGGTAIYVADNGKNVVRKLDFTNNINLAFTWAGISGTSTYVADSVPAHGWELDTTYHNAVDSAGNVYIADYVDNRIRKYMPSCSCVIVLAGTGASASNGDGGSPLAAALNAPKGVYVDSADNVYIAETGANKIRMIPSSSFTRFGVAMTSGLIYTVVNSSGNLCSGAQFPCGDGGSVTSANVRLNAPKDVITDSLGNLIISDSGNCEIRLVANSTTTVYGISPILNIIYNIGGTQLTCTSTASTIKDPDGITLDGSNNVLVPEAGGVLIRKIARSGGALSTWGGTGTICGAVTDGDLTVATIATFCNPKDITYNSSSGAIYIADSGNSLIRKVVGSTVSTLAGGGTANPGDTGPGRGASVGTPLGVAVKPGGNLYVSNGVQYADQRVIYGTDP